MTEEQKAAERAKPVSSTPVPGTPWWVSTSGHFTWNFRPN